MSALSAFILLASVSAGTATGLYKAFGEPSPAAGQFKDVPKGPNGLSLL